MYDPETERQNQMQMATPRGESASDIASTSASSVSHRETSESPQPDAASPPGQQPGGGPTESTQQGAPSQQRHGQGKILRVRALLHRVAGDLFTPHTVLIGPYHQAVRSYYFPSTKRKDDAYQDIVIEGKVDVRCLDLLVDELVDEVKACYSCLPENTLDNEALRTMLLYDGIYLLSFFIKNFYRSPETCDSGAPGSADDQMRLFKDSTLVRDVLYLLENQIPFCVLEAILNYIAAPTDDNHTLNLISKKVRHRLHKQHYISEEKQRVLDTPKPLDLLHLVYSYFRRRPQDVVAPVQEECCPPTGRWRRATDYQKYADLKFRRRRFKDGQEWSILDIELQGRTLHIPFLRVSADTWTMLRNLMALEEQEDKRPVTAYCVFMSQVACTAEDVRLLHRAKIVEHFMPSDEEAAKAFANLCNGVPLDIDSMDHNYLRQEWHDLDKRCSVRTNNLMGFFCDKYCNNAYYGLVFIIGLILFGSEVVQALFAGLGYHRPTHS